MFKAYEPKCPKIDWDINKLSKEERNSIKGRLVIGMTHSEEEFKKAIRYIWMKYGDHMDGLCDCCNSIQWNYSTHKNKATIKGASGKELDMYAFIVYDKERDMEPIGFAGSYFKEHMNDMKASEIWGHGYVLFIAPEYRRMGLASDLWLAEGQLYRDLGVRYAYEIQNEESLKVTQSMFSNPDSCKIVSPGRLKNDGTRAGIRILLDYNDKELVDRFNNMNLNMRDFNKPTMGNYSREGFADEELLKPWSKEN